MYIRNPYDSVRKKIQIDLSNNILQIDGHLKLLTQNHKHKSAQQQLESSFLVLMSFPMTIPSLPHTYPIAFADHQLQFHLGFSDSANHVVSPLLALSLISGPAVYGLPIIMMMIKKTMVSVYLVLTPSQPLF